MLRSVCSLEADSTDVDQGGESTVSHGDQFCPRDSQEIGDV